MHSPIGDSGALLVLEGHYFVKKMNGQKKIAITMKTNKNQAFLTECNLATRAVKTR